MSVEHIGMKWTRCLLQVHIKMETLKTMFPNLKEERSDEPLSQNPAEEICITKLHF